MSLPLLRGEPDSALEPVVGNLARRDHEHVLAHIDRLARFQRQGDQFAGLILGKRDPARALRPAS